MIMKGFELHKTGSRVSELLDRHFICPTLDNIPTGKTLTWQDGSYTVYFRVGEFCRVKSGTEYEFYRLHDITDNNAVWKKANSNESLDLHDYYTKEEVDNQIKQHVSNIIFPEDESVKTVSQKEYDALVANNSVSSTTIYLVESNNEPSALYIGKILIAQREEGSKGFAYNFPIIF